MIIILNIFEEFYKLFKTKSKFEQTLILAWIFMPFIMMLSKTIADFCITFIGLFFLLRCTIKSSWDWLRVFWIKWAGIFIFASIISSVFSSLVDLSMANGLSWVRFPLFVIAISAWLVKEKQILFFGLLVNFFALIFIYVLMGLESIYINPNNFTWPFRNPLNGPFIHRIGLIFFSLSFIILFSKREYKFISIIFILVSIFFSLLSGHRAGTFSFFIIILTLTFWPNFNLKRSMMITFFIVIFGTIFFYFNDEQFRRYIVEIINLSNNSLLQYIGLWKTGGYVFLSNPIIGIGPTNVQNYLQFDLIENLDPFKNNEHPHNHYLQAFAETGIIGGIAYIAMFISILFHCYKMTKVKLRKTDQLIVQSVFITSICLFWPFANNHDLFGQQQNGFLWYIISIILVSSYSINKENIK
tara:strand:- start:3715 stop:4953 length:1239 start_codon:yes stop_codon:yes gene_type:complete